MLDLPCIFLLLLIVPVLIIKKINQLKEGNLVQQFKLIEYSYFITGYKDKLFYWEFIKIYSRLLIILIQKYFSTDLKIAIIIIFFIELIYMILTSLIKPYANNHFNQLDSTSSILCCLLLLLVYLDRSFTNAEYVYIIFSNIFILLALAYILSMIFDSAIRNNRNLLNSNKTCLSLLNCIRTVLFKENSMT